MSSAENGCMPFSKCTECFGKSEDSSLCIVVQAETGFMWYLGVSETILIIYLFISHLVRMISVNFLKRSVSVSIFILRCFRSTLSF